ncbi:MAG: glycoside hydrolase family 43 protein [Acidimicrobiales bacterium]
MDKRGPRRWPVLVMVVIMIGALGAAVVTDLGAHGRARRERHALLVADSMLSVSRFDLNATRYAKGLATTHRNALKASVTSILGQVATSEGALATTNKTVSLQGLDIGALRSCLGGVRSAYEQIAAHNTTQATGDISAVSSACLTLDGGGSDGLVYPFDFPDPFVLRVGNTYLAYATNSAEGNIQIIESTDLSHWSAVGNALPTLPAWAEPGRTWAPSVLQIGSIFVLYYAAVVAGPSGGEECISVATATQPQGPFIDHSVSPLVCQANLGGSIDPSAFVDADGLSYLEWKSNGGRDQPATIWSERLNAAGTGFAGTAPTELLTADQGWEAGVIEAPDLVLSGGRYFLLYSGNNWDSANYAVGVAICSGPLGPCAQPSSQPILTSGSDWAGPGGQSVFTDSSGSLWIAFDAWVPGAVGYPHSRVLFLRQLSLSGATPVIEAPG